MTGIGESTPLSAGPIRAANPVTPSTIAVEAVRRAGRSHNGGALPTAEASMPLVSTRVQAMAVRLTPTAITELIDLPA